MEQMEVAIIEENLKNYIGRFLSDLKTIFSSANNEMYDGLDTNAKKLIHESNNINNDEDLPYIIEIVQSTSNISQISANSIRNLAIERYGESILDSLETELGLSGEASEYIFEQVKITYQARLILMLLNYKKNIFQSSSYDFFLSHCSIDSREVLGIKLSLLYDHNLISYVDWLDEYEINKQRSVEKIYTLINELLPEVDNNILCRFEWYYVNNLTDAHITNKILEAVRNSKKFLYIDSKNTRRSKWMPYELGYAEANSKPIYRVIIKYKRKRKDIIKYNSFLSKYNSVKELLQLI